MFAENEQQSLSNLSTILRNLGIDYSTERSESQLATDMVLSEFLKTYAYYNERGDVMGTVRPLRGEEQVILLQILNSELQLEQPLSLESLRSNLSTFGIEIGIKDLQMSTSTIAARLIVNHYLNIQLVERHRSGGLLADETLTLLHWLGVSQEV